MAKFSPPTIIMNEEYYDTLWEPRDKPFKYDKILKETKDGLTTMIQNKAKKRDCHTLTNEDWIDILGTLEARGDRRQEARE